MSSENTNNKKLVVIGEPLRLSSVEEAKAKFEPIYATDHFTAFLVQAVVEDQSVIAYGIFNNATGVREMEVRRQDVAVSVMDMLERVHASLGKPMSDEALATLSTANQVAA